MKSLPRITVKRKTGDEKFIGLSDGKAVVLKDFWRWSASDLVSNATRRILVPFLKSVSVHPIFGNRGKL